MSKANWSLVILLSFLWAAAFLVVDWLLPHLPPITLVALRVTLASVVLALALRLMRIALPRSRAQHRGLALLGLINAALPFAFLTIAQAEISGPMTAILNATLPITTLIALKLVLGQPMGPYRIAGVLAGVMGVAVMLNGAGQGTILAILLCLCASSCYALGQLWGLRLAGRGLHPMQAAFGQIFWAALWLWPAALLLEQPWRLPLPPPEVWAVLLGLAALSTALGYLIFFRVLASAGALASSLVTLIVPVITVLMSAALTHRLPGPRNLAGMALILCGLGLIELARRRDLQRLRAAPKVQGAAA